MRFLHRQHLEATQKCCPGSCCSEPYATPPELAPLESCPDHSFAPRGAQLLIRDELHRPLHRLPVHQPDWNRELLSGERGLLGGAQPSILDAHSALKGVARSEACFWLTH